MYGKIKRFTCFLLAVVILCFCVLPSFSASAKAAEPLTLATASIIIWLLGLMGITFASAETAKFAADSFSTSNPDIMDWVDNVKVGSGAPGDPGGEKPSIFFNAVNTAGLITFFERAKALFNANGDGVLSLEKPNYSSFTLDDGSKFTTIVAPSADKNFTTFVTDISQYPNIIDLKTLPNGGTFQIFNGVYNGHRYTYELTVFPNWKTYARYQIDNGTILETESWYQAVFSGTGKRLGYGLGCYSYGGQTFVFPCFGVEYVDPNNVLHFVPAQLDFSRYYMYSIPLVSGTTPLVVNVPYNSASKYTPQQIVDAINTEVGKRGTVVIDIPSSVADDTIPKNQDDVLVDVGIDSSLTPDGPADPDLPYKPDVTKLPDFGNIWDYVSRFVADTLIWMKLWYSGFVLMPIEIQRALWALLVITIIIGLLGVFLR